MGYTPVAPYDSKYVNISGDTMTNFLTLNADPVNSLGVPSRGSLEDELAGLSRPKDHGLIAWTYDPLFCYMNYQLMNETLQSTMIRITKAATITGVVFHNGVTPGSGPVAGRTFIGLYNLSLNKVAQTADIGSQFTTISVKKIPFTAPYSAAAGLYSIVLLGNFTNYRGELAGGMYYRNSGVGVPDPNHRFGVDYGGAMTSLPATIPTGSWYDGDKAFWFGLY